MTGVTILNTYMNEEVMANPVALIISIVAGFLIMAIIAWIDTNEMGTVIIMGILGAVLGLLVGLIVNIAVGPFEETPRYEVSLSEEVNMKEFLETYEIIDQRGNILVIEERNPDNG